MGQSVRISKNHDVILQHIEADLLRRMGEIKKLREAVQLAEAAATAKAWQQSKALTGRRVN
jgi:hypothetical protein